MGVMKRLRSVSAVLTGMLSFLSGAFLIAILWIEPIVFWETSGIVWLSVTLAFFACAIGCLVLAPPYIEVSEAVSAFGLMCAIIGFFLSVYVIFIDTLIVYSWKYWAFVVSIGWGGVLLASIYAWVKKGFGSFFGIVLIGLILTVLLTAIAVPLHSKRMKDQYAEVYKQFTYDGEFGNNYVYSVLEDGTARVTLVKGDKELTVPAEVEGHPVSQLAFCNGVKIEKGEEVEKINLPASLTEIGWYKGGQYDDWYDGVCVAVLKNLSEIGVDENNPIYRFEQGCLLKRQAVSIVLEGGSIPETGVQEIESYAYYGRKHTKAFIPANISFINGLSFGGVAGLQELEVDPENAVYHSEGNCIIDTKSKLLKTGCAGSVIPADGSVTRIGLGAFYSQQSIKKIIIPETVEKIEEYAFAYCGNMTEIVLPQTVETVGKSAFAYCGNLVIRSKARAKPAGWAANWCGPYGGVKEIVWGYKGE